MAKGNGSLEAFKEAFRHLMALATFPPTPPKPPQGIPPLRRHHALHLECHLQAAERGAAEPLFAAEFFLGGFKWPFVTRCLNVRFSGLGS